MFRRLDRVCRDALDRADYALTLGRLWLFDLIHGPEAPTPADEEREAYRERLRKAFPKTDFNGH